MELGWGITKIIPPVLYGSGIIVVILILFYRIEAGIFFLVPLIPFQNVMDWTQKYPLGKDFVDILVLAMIIKWVLNKRNSKEGLFVKNPFNLPLILLGIWSFLELLYSSSYLELPFPLNMEDPRFASWKNFMMIPLLYFIVVNNIKNPKHIKIILFFMVLSILMLDRNFVNIIRLRDTSHFSDDLRVVGSASALTGNALGVFLAQYCIVLVSVMWYVRGMWIKYLLAIPIMLSYYCVMFLFSRSGYLASVVGWTFLGIVHDRKIFVGLIVLFLFWQTLLPVAVKERIEMTKTSEGYDATTQQRFAMWKMAEGVILSSPVFGAGFDATKYLGVTDGSKSTWTSFHNGYLQQAVEMGLVGLGIYLWLFWLAIKAGWRLYKIAEDPVEKGLGLGLVGCVLACMAGNFAGTYWNYLIVMGFFWTLVALVVRATIMIEESKKDSLSEHSDTNDNDNEEKTIIPLPRKKFAVEHL